jgi:hypothetical protein
LDILIDFHRPYLMKVKTRTLENRKGAAPKVTRCIEGAAHGHEFGAIRVLQPIVFCRFYSIERRTIGYCNCLPGVRKVLDKVAELGVEIGSKAMSR